MQGCLPANGNADWVTAIRGHPLLLGLQGMDLWHHLLSTYMNGRFLAGISSSLCTLQNCPNGGSAAWATSIPLLPHSECRHQQAWHILEFLVHTRGEGEGYNSANYGLCSFLCTAHKAGLVSAYSNIWKKNQKKSNIFEKWILHEVYISASLNKVLLEHRNAHLVPTSGGCSPTARAELSGWDHTFYKSPLQKNLLTPPTLGINLILHLIILWKNKLSALHLKTSHQKIRCDTQERPLHC